MRLVHNGFQGFKRIQPSTGFHPGGWRKRAVQRNELTEVAKVLTLRNQSIGRCGEARVRCRRMEVMVHRGKECSASNCDGCNERKQNDADFLGHDSHCGLPPLDAALGISNRRSNRSILQFRSKDAPKCRVSDCTTEHYRKVRTTLTTVCPNGTLVHAIAVQAPWWPANVSTTPLEAINGTIDGTVGNGLTTGTVHFVRKF